MANQKPAGKKQQTVRERTRTAGNKKTRRIRNTAGKAAGPIKKANAFGKREYHVVPVPDNNFGDFLGKKGRLLPLFVHEAWDELKGVTWPNAHDTMRLTLAVFIFAVVFASIVGVIDFGLDKLFREVIIGK